MENKMRAKNFLASLVAVFALAFVLMPMASAFAEFDNVYIDGIDYGVAPVVPVDVVAGDLMSIDVRFTANASLPEGFVKDVRVYARIVGEPGSDGYSERFDVIEGVQYTRGGLNVQLPSRIDDLDETKTLEIKLETKAGLSVTTFVELKIQRENYKVTILSIETPKEISAGENLALDIVLKNTGRHQSEDTFVTVEIPMLGISTRAYFGDLAPKDPVEGIDEDEYDSAERRMYLKMPSNVETGIYDVEVTAFSDDSETTVIKRIVVVAGESSSIFSGDNSETFAVGEKASYSMTIVNPSNEIKIYTLVVDSVDNLNVDLEESIVVVPAGSARAVKFTVDAEEDGNYNFAVNVHSDNELVQTESFTANVEGTSFGGNSAAVVLTIILAIIFIVLLIVLIVLLTRKPEKNEEFGESYY